MQEDAAIGEVVGLRPGNHKRATPLITLWRVIARHWRRLFLANDAVMLGHTLLMHVIVRPDRLPITGMMGARRGRTSVLVMQATSKRNVRSECDERQAMNEASKHEDFHSEVRLMAVGLFVSDDSRSIAIVSKSQSLTQRVLYGRDDLAKGHATRSEQ